MAYNSDKQFSDAVISLGAIAAAIQAQGYKPFTKFKTLLSGAQRVAVNVNYGDNEAAVIGYVSAQGFYAGHIADDGESETHTALSFAQALAKFGEYLQ